MYQGLLRVSSFVIIIFSIFLLSCGGGGGGGDSSPAKSPGVAIEPDEEYTGSDCSYGSKINNTSGMTFSNCTARFEPLKKVEYVPGEVLVKFKEGISQARATQIMGKFGSKNIGVFSSIKNNKKSLLKKVKLKQHITVNQAVKQYRMLREVEFVEPNYIYRAMATTPNDPDYSVQWGLNNNAQNVNGTSGTAGKDIDIEAAWDTLTDCPDVIVAVVDTGVNYNHRDLSVNMWDGGSSYPNHGYDCVDEDADPMDFNGHGTHCAGIIGAQGDDSTGIAGVCWDVKLMAVRVLDATGSGTLEDIAQGIIFAVDNGVHVINASLGGPHSQTMEDAVSYARDNGVLIVAAAGNDATDDNTYSYPAAFSISHDNVLSVAAVDQDGARADFSNYGISWVNIAAPGVNILSTWPGQTVITEETFDDWSLGTGWATGTYTYGSIDLKMLTNPDNFGVDNYQNNLSSIAYQVFDLDAYGAVSAVASFYADINVEYDWDYLYYVKNENGGAPGTVVETYSGDYGGIGYAGEYDYTSIIGKNLSLGFKLESDISYTYNGVGIAMFSMQRMYLNETACLYSDGTSMAAPYVAGVVAMSIQRYMNVKGTYTKNLHYTDIKDAVFNGADQTVVSGVESGRMLNASGAIGLIVP